MPWPWSRRRRHDWRSACKCDGHGLLSLGADEPGTGLPALFSYWREFGTRYITALCALPGIGEGTAKAPVPLPAAEDLTRLPALHRR